MVIRPGDYIQHPKCLDWGIGKVTSVLFNGSYCVLFENCGEKTLNFQNLPFNPIKVEPSQDIINEFNNKIEAKAKEEEAKQKERERIKIESKHKAFIERLGLQYPGVQYSASDHHRITHCYSCKKHLDNKFDIECRKCGWIICFCGACGCGYKGL